MDNQTRLCSEVGETNLSVLEKPGRRISSSKHKVRMVADARAAEEVKLLRAML